MPAVSAESPMVRRPADLSFRKSLPAIGVSLAAAMGGLLYGYDTGTISGILAQKRFINDFGNSTDSNGHRSLSTSDTSMVTSLLSVGTFFGALAGAPLADYLGRKNAIHISNLIFVLGVALQVGAGYQDLSIFIGGRVTAGVGVGIISTVVPTYQSECAPRWIRGAIVGAYQWAITIGLLLASGVNLGTSNYGDTTAQYRVPIAIQFAWAIMLSSALLFMPESPRWLIRAGREQQARKALARLHSEEPDSEEITVEYVEIKSNLDEELRQCSPGLRGYLDCFRMGDRKYLLRTLTGMGIQFWQQFTGINYIFYYGTVFFRQAVPNGVSDFVLALIPNIVNMVTTIPGLLVVDKIGRRKMLIAGAAWMTVCHLIVAVVSIATPESNTASRNAMVAFVCLFVAGFASTWGPIAWVVCGEIFPLAIRAKAMSLCSASNWAINVALGSSTPYIVERIHTKVFFVWMATTACGLVFVYFFVYETMGLSLEEVDELYGQTSTLRSAAVNKAMHERRGRDVAEPGEWHLPDEDVESGTDKKLDETKVDTVTAL